MSTVRVPKFRTREEVIAWSLEYDRGFSEGDSDGCLAVGSMEPDDEDDEDPTDEA